MISNSQRDAIIRSHLEKRRNLMELTIEFLNGEKDQFYVDSCHVTETCLIYKNKSGEYYIPLSNIKRYRVCR